MKLFKEIYAYREMIASLVRKDLRGRYKGSVFGFLWTFINPLLQLLVYTLVFSAVLRFGIEKYYLFLFVALVPWMFFAACISTGAGIINAEQNLIVKIDFPREVIPIYFVTSNFINMLYCFIIVIAVVIISGIKISLTAWLCLPVIMAVEYIMALGLCFLLSAVGVYFRDLQHIMGIIGMAWYFLTPIFYPIEMVTESMIPIFMLNPMTPVIIAYRDVLYYGKVPELFTLLHATAFGIVILIIGLIVFGQLKKRFAEVL